MPSMKLKKKMIITSMLRRQVWMTNGNEFDYIVKNSQNSEEFTKQCSVMFIYGTYKADVIFSLINRMRAWNYLQKHQIFH